MRKIINKVKQYYFANIHRLGWYFKLFKINKKNKRYYWC